MSSTSPEPVTRDGGAFVNTARAVALLREIADLDGRRAQLHRELAETMAEGEGATSAPANDTKRRPRRPVPIRVPTDVEITDVDRAKAASVMRRMGMRVR